MQRAKTVFMVAIVLAFAAYVLPCPANESDEKRPPITLKVGEELVVDLKGVREAVAVLEPSEKTEFVRDVLLTTAFAAFPSSHECRHDFLAVYGALRRPHLDPLSPGEVGRGRFAALSKETGLLLLPFDATGKSFDLTVAYRILDKQFCLEGKLPDVIQVVAYRLRTAERDDVRASLTQLASIQTKKFYTNDEHGYTEQEVAENADLENFLKGVDDLLSVRVKGATLIVAGRKYPEATYRVKVRDRVTLDDLRVLWAAFHDSKAAEAKATAKIKDRLKDKNLSDELLALLVKRQLEAVGEKGSELGFSLDPWIDLKKLRQLLGQVLREEMLLEELTGDHIDRLKKCKDRVDAIVKNQSEEPDADKRSPVMEVPSSKEDDHTGLFVFKDDVSHESIKSPNDRKVKLISDLLKEITHESQFIRARYEGVQPGTPVAMTMFYCDLIAKAYAFGQLGVTPVFGDPRVERITGLPRVDGFESWPGIQLGGQYWGEVHKAKSLRLWWSADINGFRWDQKGEELQIVFCPQAVRISFRNKVGEIAQEEEPDPLRAVFRDRWNRNYLDIADQDCVFHHFNQLYKWSIAIKWLKELNQPEGLKQLSEGPALAVTNLRFDKWYQDAVRQKKVGFQVKFDLSKRYKGITEETMGFVHSGEYEEAGRIAGWVGGGDLGPTKGDVESAKRAASPGRVQGTEITLPLGRRIVVPGDGQERVAVLPPNPFRMESPSVRLPLPRARLESEMLLRPEAATLRNWMSNDSVAIDSSLLTTKMVDGRAVVEWKNGTFDRALSITRAIGAGHALDANQVTEVRYSENGDRMLLRLTGEHSDNSQPVWVEVQPGGIGGDKGPPSGAVAIGSPGEPGWYYTRVRHDLADNELAKYIPKNGKGFIRVELSGRAFSPYRFDTEWFPNAPGLPSPVSLFGKGVTRDEVKASLLNASAEENRFASLLFGTIADPVNAKRLTDMARLGLQKDVQDESFDLFARMIGRGATPVEIRIGTGIDRLTVANQSGIYVVSRSAEADSLIRTGNLFRYVVTEPETPTQRGVRILDRTLILPENPTDIHRKTAREVVDFLTDNPDLITIASSVSDLNGDVLAKLKTSHEAIGKSAVLEWSADAKAFYFKDTNIKFTEAQLRRWSNTGDSLPDGALDEMKRQPLVLEGLPAEYFNMTVNGTGRALRKLQAEGVQIAFKLSDTDANAMPVRLKGLMSWNQLDFEAESVALDKVTNEEVKQFAIGYLRLKSLPPLLARDGDSIPLVRVIVDHAESKLTIQELIDRANQGEYHNRHVVLGVCNDSPSDIVAFCKAAYANGCRGVVIPSDKVSIPITLLTAEFLSANPQFRIGNTPQAAWRNAEESVLEKLETVKADAKGNDVDALQLIDRAFPVQPSEKKWSEMFRDQDGQPQGAIGRIDEFMQDAKRNTWNQTTSRKPILSETRIAAYGVQSQSGQGSIDFSPRPRLGKV